ncbi:cache domain-containing sensor histidine kinase [Paenibacillus elgii]|uniref:cache domain-containing sensor histidine kinase n=1 Tax=Paenibacillus elgii TaxID=189691 RepID=UPI001EF8E3D6|nr:sensor histidine kinase [Paenibacillus elgii]
MLTAMKNRVLDYYYSLSVNKKITRSFMTVLSLLLILLSVFTYRVSSAILIDKAIENTEQNLRLVSEKLEIILDNSENYSKIAITNNSVQRYLSAPPTSDPLENYNRSVEVSNALADIVDSKTFVDGMLIYDRNGHLYDSGGLKNVRNVNDEYVRAFSGSTYGPVWKDTAKSNYEKEGGAHPVVSLLQKFNTAKDGSPLGVIQLSIDERYIADQYAHINIGHSGEIFIVNKQGTIASHSDKSRLYASIGQEPYYSWVIGHEGGRTFSLNGEDNLVVARTYPRLNWIIVGIVPIKEITRDNQILMEKTFYLSLIFVVSAIILTILIARSITRPLNQIKKTVKSVQEGNLDVWLELKERDEIGALAREFNKMVVRTKTLMENMVEEQKKKKEYELAVMQSQINPHFLYNTLESICALADLKRNADIVNIVNQLALFYRGVLSKGSHIISMEDEIIITQTYLEILKVRYGDRLDSRFEIDDNVYKYSTIKLLLQPIVENSINHGLRNKRGKGLIRIQAYVLDGKVRIEVSDNGTGITPQRLRQILKPNPGHYRTKSFGLKSTDERIKLYFGSEYGLEIDSVPGEGTTVRMTLPAIENGGIPHDSSDDRR